MPLVLFFGITIVALDVVFRDVVDRSLVALLDAQMIALMAAADPNSDGSGVAFERATDPRLETPGSGLYAGIDARGGHWRSRSTAGTRIDFGPPLTPGAERRMRTTLADGTRVSIASRGIAWEAADGDGGDANTYALTFSVATSLTPYEQQVWTFRTQVFGWFVLLTVLLLALLVVLLRWMLAPTRRLEREIGEIESGRRESLSPRWPRELAGVAGNLNALLAAERARITRYRHTLGNLAHSLKTPLAVMRTALGPSREAEPSADAVLEREIDRMAGIVNHQLRRAAASGGVTVGQLAVEVRPVVSDLRVALLRAHGSRDFVIDNAVDADARFMGDRDDLMEMLGNLLDNACKWCRSRVSISATLDETAPTRRRLVIEIADDGPGIAGDDRARVLERGERADESAPGHGLGLAMVRDTVELYGGSLEIEEASGGGARVRLRLPGPPAD